jgi:hypothetical protein
MRRVARRLCTRALFLFVPVVVLAGFLVFAQSAPASVEKTTNSTGIPSTPRLNSLAVPLPSPFSPVAAASPGSVNGLGSTACVSDDDCWSVGAFTPTTAGVIPRQQTLVEHWDGNTWTVTPSADTGGADVLSAITCVNSDDCWAVGNTFSSSDAQVTLAEQWDGADWSIVPTPTLPSSSGWLFGVSCSGANACWAVGGNTQNGSEVDLVEGWNGQSWSIANTPTVNGVLGSISCPEQNECLAVGSELGFEVTPPSSLEWNGATWSSVAVAVPSPTLDTTLVGVDCTTDSNCFAVGSSGTGDDGTNQALAEQWNGTSWSISPTPDGSASTHSYLSSVSCASTTDCWAVGGGNPGFQMILNWNGATWSSEPLPPSSILTSFDGITCASTTDCWIVGGVYNGNETVAVAMNGPSGYWLVGSDGGIFTFGSADFYGSTGALTLQRPVVGITPTPDEGGYWLVASDGGIFSFGDAGFFGSIPGLGLAPAGSSNPKRLNSPIVGMVPSADGGGYFMVASDGGVFAFGDAKFEGSCPGIGGCSGAAVAVMPDASGNGYWLVTATGHVYTFGDATNYGAPGPQAVPVTAAVRTTDGKGYWLLFSNGAIAAYGDAASLGGPVGSVGGFNPATAIFTTSEGGGYWVASANGSLYTYGDAPNDGSMAGQHLNGSIIAGTGW